MLRDVVLLSPGVPSVVLLFETEHRPEPYGVEATVDSQHVKVIKKTLEIRDDCAPVVIITVLPQAGIAVQDCTLTVLMHYTGTVVCRKITLTGNEEKYLSLLAGK